MITISGKVTKGDKYGRRLGFPTANLDRRDYNRRKLKVRLGVYAGYAEFDLEAKSYKLKAGIVIGPLDSKRLPKIEAHLIGFDGNLYGMRLVLALTRYLRPFKEFKNEEELKKQIKKDIKEVLSSKP